MPQGHFINPKLDGSNQTLSHFYRRPHPRGGCARSRASLVPSGDPLRALTGMAAPDCLKCAGSSWQGGSALPHVEAVCASTAHKTGSGGSRELGWSRDWTGPLSPMGCVPQKTHLETFCTRDLHSGGGRLGSCSLECTYKTLGQTKKSLLLT